MAGLCTSALWDFQDDLKQAWEQKREGGRERERQVGQASVAGWPQLGVEQRGTASVEGGTVESVGAAVAEAVESAMTAREGVWSASLVRACRGCGEVRRRGRG